MGKLRHLLDRINARIGRTEAATRRAVKRYKKFHARTVSNHEQQKRHEKEADLARRKGEPAKAERHDRKAARCQHRAERSHGKAIYWRGRVKKLRAETEHLTVRKDEVEHELQKWLREHGPRIEGNKVVGGTPEQRWRAAALASVANCSNGKRRNFYSQAGGWDVTHEIAPGPSYGERSDCSSYVTGIAWSADLPDPNGEDFRAGFTGTLKTAAGPWKRVSVEQMKRHGWGYVVYGGGVGHHTEAYIGPGDRTAGHGSPPVDFGTINLFGDGDYTCYVFEGDGGHGKHKGRKR